MPSSFGTPLAMASSCISCCMADAGAAREAEMDQTAAADRSSLEVGISAGTVLLTSSDKASKFERVQLRSVLDTRGGSADATWTRLLSSVSLLSHSETAIDLALPCGEDAEGALLSAVEALADTMGPDDTALATFYQHFGWASPAEYFDAMGEAHVMLVDVDCNDSDDRLAIILLAYQLASANLARRQAMQLADGQAPSECALFLDARTYEGRDVGFGIIAFRTARLAARLRAELGERCGLRIEVLFSDGARALRLVAEYLAAASSGAALEEEIASVVVFFQGGSSGACRDNFRGIPASNGGTVWLLSGMCRQQVDDLQHEALEGKRLRIVEQAQPAWQSDDVGNAAVQPDWTFPPSTDAGYGVEPSNVRSSGLGYYDAIENYVRFQQVVSSASAGWSYLAPALSRSDGWLPAPPGQEMMRISGRPLNVLPGESYTIKKSVNKGRAEEAFRRILAAARAGPVELHAELCISTADDAGVERTEMAHIKKYGSFMADAVVVALAARPLSQLQTTAVVRRLAVVKIPA